MPITIVINLFEKGIMLNLPNIKIPYIWSRLEAIRNFDFTGKEADKLMRMLMMAYSKIIDHENGVFYKTHGVWDFKNVFSDMRDETLQALPTEPDFYFWVGRIHRAIILLDELSMKGVELFVESSRGTIRFAEVFNIDIKAINTKTNTTILLRGRDWKNANTFLKSQTPCVIWREPHLESLDYWKEHKRICVAIEENKKYVPNPNITLEERHVNHPSPYI